MAAVGHANAAADDHRVTVGRDGYPQPEIVAIATGKPPNAAAVRSGPAALAAAGRFGDIEFGGGVLRERPPSAVSVVDLTNLDAIAEADDDSVEM